MQPGPIFDCIQYLFESLFLDTVSSMIPHFPRNSLGGFFDGRFKSEVNVTQGTACNLYPLKSYNFLSRLSKVQR